MEIDEPGDALAVVALEIALEEGEEGKILVEGDEPENIGANVNGKSKLPTKWVTAESHELILEAICKAPNLQCNLCETTFTHRKRLRLHARLHYVHSFH